MERLLIIFVFIALAYGQFSPFDDSILFEISWPTKHPLNHETSLTEELEFESLTTPDNEQYKCYISHQPQAQSTDEGVIGNSLTPDVLLKEVIESKECVYLVEGYWTYELCYGVSLRQFHEDKNKEGKVIKSLEFLLGKFDSKGSLPPSTVDVPPTWFYVNKNYPYYEITLENGSPCDIRESTNRLTHLLFICDSEQSPVASLVMIKETTTCEYQAVVATSQLCQNSLYQIKKKPVHPIQCHAVDGGPSKPIRLDQHERQMKELLSGDSSEQSVQSKMNPVFSRSNSNNLPQDETFVANFLNGDACLIGSFSNWWEHELCFKKYVRHVHREDGIVKQSISLGVWNEKVHKKWYSDTLKSKISKNHVIHYYGDGDMCDVTGKPRQTRIKFKCMKSKSNNQISLYMEELSPCNYLLTVEAGFICTLLQSLDNHGLFLTTNT